MEQIYPVVKPAKRKIKKPELFCLKSPKLNEYQECKKFWRWVVITPVAKDHMFKIVNEGRRSIKEGFSLMHIGMRKGLPDYALPIARSGFLGLWIEMKIIEKRGKKPDSIDQDEWLTRLRHAGHYATYSYGADEAIRITTDYLAGRIVANGF